LKWLRFGAKVSACSASLSGGKALAGFFCDLNSRVLIVRSKKG
jgi:hypothetical protein